MPDRSMIIIGAGMAGLATGCYARMNGYEPHIVEMEQRPGGVCTSWRRQEYIFDGCLQWLVGSRPGSPFNQIWQELGALAGRNIVDHEEYERIEGRDGQALIVYTDADRLEAHLKQLAPADAATSHQLCELIRRFAVFSAHATRLDMARELLPAFPTLAPLFGSTWQQFAARYTDHFVRDAIRAVCDAPDFPFLAGVFMLAWMHARDAGYPIGGSLAFAQAIAQRYEELGGQVTYGARVAEILVEANRAVGVRLADGQVLRADDVISAADGHTTIFDLLGGRYVDQRIRRRYATGRLFAPLVQVSLGVARDLSGEPHFLRFPLRTPTRIAGRVREELTVRHYGYDPTLAPSGKAALAVQLETNYDEWTQLARDPDRYENEKQGVATAVIAGLEERFPGLADAIEVVDVATPMTWVRHTSNWRASFEGWQPTRSAGAAFLRGPRRTLPGLDHFLMVGQWVDMGGLPSVARGGRELVRQLCERDGKEFTTSVASHPPAQVLPQFPEHRAA